MRRFAVIVGTLLAVAALLPALAPPAQAQVPTPTLNVDVLGETNNSQQVFSPDQLLIPQVPINLVVTFRNSDTTLDHSFTINDENGTIQINSGILAPGANATMSFTVLSMTRIVYNGTGFTPEAGPNGILYYCIPHRGQGTPGNGMVGQIILASVQQGGVPEKGILLRAYWIGIIGIVSMLAWIGISYFLIKSSSRHFTDHAEHVRKGLP